MFEIRWTVQDAKGNEIYLTEERWQHIIDPINHPEMIEYEANLRSTIRRGKRRRDDFNPHKFRYSLSFTDLPAYNTHIVAIVLFRFEPDEDGFPRPNNYIVTAYQKEIW